MSRDSQIQKIAERILEDESLRRDLTDDGFQPLLDWAMDQLTRSNRAKSNPTAFGAQVRSVLQAASIAASSRDLIPLRSVLTSPLFSSRDSKRIVNALSKLRLTDDPTTNSTQIATLLAVKR